MTADDDSHLARQLALTEALRAELERQGTEPDVRSRVEAFFFAGERRAAEQLAAAVQHGCDLDGFGFSRP